MADDNKGFFDMVDEIVSAMETRDYVRTELPEKWGENKQTSILYSTGLSGERNKIESLAFFLEVALGLQISEDEVMPPEGYGIGVANYKGRDCIYYDWPDDKEIDFYLLREHIRSSQELLCEDGDPGLEVPAGLVTLGPLHSSFETKVLDRVLELVETFVHGEPLTGPVPVVHTDKGRFAIVNRPEFMQLFRHEKEFQPTAAADRVRHMANLSPYVC